MNIPIINNELDFSLNNLNKKERNEAMSLLLLYGFQQYVKITNNSNIDITLLRKLLDFKINLPNSSKSNHNINNLTNSIGTTINKNSSIKSKDLRVSRLNAMSHYPFIDEGTISDILKPKTSSNTNSFLSIGTPAKKRLAIKAFSEYQTGNTGLKIEDIPKAIEFLGLNIPKSLENIQLSNQSNEFIPISTNNDKILKLTISLNQWLKFLNKYVIIYQSGSYNDLDFYQFISLIDNRYNKLSNQKDNQIDDSNIVDSDLDLESFSVDEEIIAKPKKKKSKKLTIEKPKDTYTTKLRKVKSRIKEQIDKDRNDYMKTQKQIDDAALRAIARRRYEQIMSNDIHHHRNEKLSSNVLSRGSGALEIADAFLNGPLAKEVQGYESSEESSISFDDNLEKKTNFIKVDNKIDNKIENKIDTKLESKNESKSSNKSSDISSLYKHEWKSTKGGWMADFGPNHTHTIKKLSSNDIQNISSSEESSKPLQSYLSNTVDKSIYSNLSNSIGTNNLSSSLFINDNITTKSNKINNLNTVNELIKKYSSDISLNNDVDSTKIEKILSLYKNDIDISTEEDSLSMK